MMQIIVPKTDDVCGAKSMAKALQAALDACAQGAKADFKVTTRTWQRQPDFVIDKGDPERRVVGTNDVIYGYVNHGTRPHLIMPRGRRILTWVGANYRAKTTPGQIRSGAGGNDNTIVWARRVQHPGNAARKFDEMIMQKWSKEMPTKIQQAILAVTEDLAKTPSE